MGDAGRPGFAVDATVSRRAFTRSTGAALWKAKAQEAAGVRGVAALGDLVLAAFDDGFVRALDASTGDLRAELSIAQPKSKNDAPLGGVVVHEGGVVVSSAQGGKATLTFLRAAPDELTVTATVSWGAEGADAGFTSVGPPLAHGARVALAGRYTVADYGRVAVAVCDPSGVVAAPHVLTGTDDPLRVASAPDGSLVWSRGQDVVLASMPSL